MDNRPRSSRPGKAESANRLRPWLSPTARPRVCRSCLSRSDLSHPFVQVTCGCVCLRPGGVGLRPTLARPAPRSSGRGAPGSGCTARPTPGGRRPRTQAPAAAGRLHDDMLSGKVPAGSALAVATLDRLGLTIRETSRLVRELHEPGAGVRTLADVLDLDATPPLTAAAELALAVLGLVEDAGAPQRERVELSRAIAAGKGQQLGRARQVDPLTLAEALRLYDDGVPVAEIEQRMNITRSAFYRLAARERGGPVGVRRRRRPGLPEETRAGLLNLKGQMSMRRPAAVYEVSVSTVHGLWRRPIRRPQPTQDGPPPSAPSPDRS